MSRSLRAWGRNRLDSEDGEDVTCEAPEKLHTESV